MINFKNPYVHGLIVISLILVAIFISILLGFVGWGENKYTGFAKYLFTIMNGYLFFTFARTGVHLVLSFGNIFFKKEEKKPASYPLVSVIIPCFNEGLVIKKAVESVLKQTYPNFEIIIVDDGSLDDTLDIGSFLSRRAKIRVISQKNAGKAEALNRALGDAYGEYFLCMDADSVFKNDVIEIGMWHFEQNEKVAAVAGAVEIGNVNSALTSFQRLEYISGLNLFKVAQSFLGMVTVIPGPVGLFKKSMVIEVGGYSSSTYAEDCELTVRLLIAGYQTIYAPKMIAVTEAPEEFNSLISQRYRWSRGVIQAIRVNIYWLFHPFKNFRNFMLIVYMMSESIFIPTANFVFAIFTIEYSLFYHVESIFGYFFAQLTLLDIALALFCIITERRSLSLIVYALLNRVSYGFSLEVIRFFSMIDEFLSLPMSWAKLVRKGM